MFQIRISSLNRRGFMFKLCFIDWNNRCLERYLSYTLIHLDLLWIYWHIILWNQDFSFDLRRWLVVGQTRHYELLWHSLVCSLIKILRVDCHWLFLLLKYYLFSRFEWSPARVDILFLLVLDERQSWR